ARTGWRLTPDAIRPPSAVPLPPAIEKRRISRREISIAETPFSYGRTARARRSTDARVGTYTPAYAQKPRQLHVQSRCLHSARHRLGVWRYAPRDDGPSHMPRLSDI